jgi:hypothetical protein
MVRRLFAICLLTFLCTTGIAQELVETNESATDSVATADSTGATIDTAGSNIVETTQSTTTEGIVTAPENSGNAAQTTEAGKYEKKSVSYVNKLWALDQTIEDLKDADVKLLLKTIQNLLISRRFDYNPISDELFSEFQSCAKEDTATETDSSIAWIAQCMDKTIVPKILEVVNLQKEIRAAGLTTEQQRNSFFSDKTKSLGITMDQVDKIMNSSFIYMPMISDISISEDEETYDISAEVGIIWFRILTSGDSAKAVVVLKEFKTSMASAKVGRVFVTKNGPINHEAYAFRALAENAARNLLMITRKIPEFELSAQVLEKRASSVTFELGKQEGLKIGDKFKIMETIENEDGTVTLKNNGWIMVKSVGDTTSKQGYKSRGKVVSGRPYLGAVLTEFPRLPLDIVFRARNFTREFESIEGIDLSMAFGPAVSASYNFGPHIGFRQFFFDVGAGLGFGVVKDAQPSEEFVRAQEDDYDFNKTIDLDLDASLTLKLPLRRISLMLQLASFGYHQTTLYTRTLLEDTRYRLNDGALVLGSGAGLEFALKPQLSIGAAAGFNYLPISLTSKISSKYGRDGEWSSGYESGFSKLNRRGFTFQVYATYSPPALPFDPASMGRGLLGF